MDGSGFHGAPGDGARIGPNAILQTAAVLDRLYGRAERSRILMLAGVALPPPDSGMVPEADCRAVHHAVRQHLGAEAARVLRLSGLATADYILANRIPAVARATIRALPAALGSRLLAKAIARHAWTFAGSGQFRIVSFAPLTFEILDNPLRARLAAQPECHWHAAVFERLFTRLVWPCVGVTEISCGSVNGGPCRFVLSPKGRTAPATDDVNPRVH